MRYIPENPEPGKGPQSGVWLVRPVQTRQKTLPSKKISHSDLITIHCLAYGLTMKEVAKRLNLTYNGVQKKINRLCRVLNVRNTQQLITWYGQQFAEHVYLDVMAEVK